mmetsp:Transcript_27612/g.58357  ORF Transcript_27612/g.58357 Transcript_27612/m.58357 type:complete len:871 (-) Transcript_27612:119-2731(-)|eukprot:CAMPEP_0183743714 /NCGR_PEP_ID=MMETSP0737-20130205/65360_1 /TAXON_ID=385413 /ORGANISM="Thalassiosira miniscula, Strain CCMP1093" /LENGTH=870 /DNA_ID=CAMNT_0025979341 /DNA_START=641 /DNA_END=3253 /DNA_ORIENTATION=-
MRIQFRQSKVAEALTPNPTELDLFLANIGDAGAKELSIALKLRDSTLQTIDLGSNRIGDLGAKDLASALKRNTTLRELELWKNQIGNDGVRELAKALSVNLTLKKINLSWNSFGDEGAKALAAALTVNSTLEEMGLNAVRCGDRIGLEGALALAAALKVNQTLLAINLDGNQIGNEGAKELADALRVNSTLERIQLYHTNIGNEGAKHLASALKVNSTLRKIDLGDNQIGDEGAKELAAALMANKSLQTVHLAHNPIGNKTMDKINALLADPARRANGDAPDKKLKTSNRSDAGSLFYEQLAKLDDGHSESLVQKLELLCPLIADVHMLRFYYTAISSLHRSQCLTRRQASDHIANGLSRSSELYLCQNAIAVYKLVLEKSLQDEYLTTEDYFYYDERVHRKKTERAPFVRDIMESVRKNAVRLDDDPVVNNAAAADIGGEQPTGMKKNATKNNNKTDNNHNNINHHWKSTRRRSVVKANGGLERTLKVKDTAEVLRALMQIFSSTSSHDTTNDVASTTEDSSSSLTVDSSASYSSIATFLERIVDFGDIVHLKYLAAKSGKEEWMQQVEEGIRQCASKNNHRPLLSTKKDAVLQQKANDSTILLQLSSNAAAMHPSPHGLLSSLGDEFKAKGNASLQRDDVEGAIQWYSKAIDVDDKTNPLHYSNRSAAYLRNGDAWSALEDANASISLDSTFGRGYVQRGRALHALKQYQDAMAVYEEGLTHCQVGQHNNNSNNENSNSNHALLQKGLNDVRNDREYKNRLVHRIYDLVDIRENASASSLDDGPPLHPHESEGGGASLALTSAESTISELTSVWETKPETVAMKPSKGGGQQQQQHRASCATLETEYRQSPGSSHVRGSTMKKVPRSI